MGEFYPAAQQLQYPDILASYVRGQMAPLQVQAAQQDVTHGALQLDQLRQIMNLSQQIAGPQGAQNQGGPTGGIQNGPQGQVSSQPPSPSGSYDGSVGMPPVNTMMALDVLQGRDPLKSAQYVQQNMLERRKLELQGPINLAQRLQTDPYANIIVAKNPTLYQMWKGWAAQRGLNPDDPTNLTVQHAQLAARDYESQLQGQLGQSSTAGFTGTLKPGEAAYQGGQMVAGSPDTMTPYQSAELKLRRDELAARGSEQRKPQLVDVPMPDGTTQKQWIVPGQDTGLNVGAPEAAKPGQGMGRVQQMVGRLTLAGNEVTKSAENLMKLGINTDSGWLGISNPQHGGILTAMKNALTNTVSQADTRAYAIMVSGVKRNLAAIEAAGNMPPGSLTAQMDQVELKPGDTQLNKLQRMAEIRQISQAGLESMLTQPGLSKQQIEQIQGINERMAKAIPFTQEDILNLQQSKNPHMTISDMANATGATSAHPPEVQSLLNKYK